MKDIRELFKEESEIEWENSQGEPDIEYVFFLEDKLRKAVEALIEEARGYQNVAMWRRSRNLISVIEEITGEKWEEIDG